MSATGLRSFDATVQTTNEWLDDLMQELHVEDRGQAYQAMRAVLHALRDRLTVDEATDLAAQLPMLVRGFYYEGYHPSDKPDKERSQQEFLDHVERELDGELNGKADLATRSVFKVLEKHVTAGQAGHVKSSLPADIRKLWEE